MSKKKLHIKKGDQVRILAGEHRGEQGQVLKVEYAKNRAIVEGKNLVSKHTRPSAAHPEGGIIQEEAGIHISNLMLVDGKGNATRIGRKKDDSGKLVRYSKKTGEVIK